MSERIHDESMALPSGFGSLATAGREPNLFRVGRYVSREGLVHITEWVEESGQQVVTMNAVLDGRFWKRQIERPNRKRHLTERGIYIVAGRWLRELGGES